MLNEGAPDHELQATSSQSSADTTLGTDGGDSVSTSMAINHTSSNEHALARTEANKTTPIVPNVDFSY